MTSKQVRLHGGPLHGTYLVVRDDEDHIHIESFGPECLLSAPQEQDSTEHVVTREGTYSQVAGPDNRNNYEWDGWVSH